MVYVSPAATHSSSTLRIYAQPTPGFRQEDRARTFSLQSEVTWSSTGEPRVRQKTKPVAKHHRSQTGLRALFRCGQDASLYDAPTLSPRLVKHSAKGTEEIPPVPRRVDMPISAAVDSHNTLGIAPSLFNRSIYELEGFGEQGSPSVRLVGGLHAHESSWSLNPSTSHARLSSSGAIADMTGTIPNAPQRFSSQCQPAAAHERAAASGGTSDRLIPTMATISSKASLSGYHRDTFYDPRSGQNPIPATSTVRADLRAGAEARLPPQPSMRLATSLSSYSVASVEETRKATMASLRRRRRYAVPHLSASSIAALSEIGDATKADESFVISPTSSLLIETLKAGDTVDRTSNRDSTVTASTSGNDSKVSESSSGMSSLLGRFPSEADMLTQRSRTLGDVLETSEDSPATKGGLAIPRSGQEHARAVSMVRSALREDLTDDDGRSSDQDTLLQTPDLEEVPRKHRGFVVRRQSSQDSLEEDDGYLSPSFDEAVRTSFELVEDLSFRRQMQTHDTKHSFRTASQGSALDSSAAEERSVRTTFGDSSALGKMSRGYPSLYEHWQEQDPERVTWSRKSSHSRRQENSSGESMAMRRSQASSFRPGSGESGFRSRCSSMSTTCSEGRNSPSFPPPDSPLPPLPSEPASRNASVLLKRSTFGNLTESHVRRISEDKRTLCESHTIHRKSSRLRGDSIVQQSTDTSSLARYRTLKKTLSRGKLYSCDGESIRSSQTLIDFDPVEAKGRVGSDGLELHRKVADGLNGHSHGY